MKLNSKGIHRWTQLKTPEVTGVKKGLVPGPSDLNKSWNLAFH